MFIRLLTKEIFTYWHLQQLPEFEGVCWPADQSVHGIDTLIAEKGFARFVETPAPETDADHVAEKAGAELVEGQWQRVWVVREKTVEERNADIVMQIYHLDAQQTPRRIREAALSDAGRVWLENLDAEIAALRQQLSQEV